MKNLAFLVGVVLVVSVLAGGCQDEEVEQTREVLRGTYFVDHPAFVGGEKTDSLTMTVTDNRSYVLNHYPDPSGDDVEFCGSSGTLGAWGGTLVTFSPDQTFGANCDAARVPRGQFQADFRTHGDTIHLDKTVADSIFRIRLIPE